MTETTDSDSTADEAADALRKMVIPNSVARLKVEAAADGSYTAAPTEVTYSLPDRPEPPPIPNGWYTIAESTDIEVGQILSLVAVGRELVAYRDQGGEARVADAHCPHLGAHLGGGHVVDAGIKCPYHGWVFDDAGTCVEIPYSDARIPAKACVRSYRVVEREGLIYFWFHAADADPPYEVPPLEEAIAEGWSAPHTYRLEMVASLQEMAENNVDYAHLRYVHKRPYVPDDTSQFITDGPFSTVIEKLPDGQEFYRYTYGPGVALLRIENVMTVYATTTPIDRNHCRLLWHFYFCGPIEEAAEELIDGVTGQFGLQADVPIWRDKVFLERPVLVKGDGNIAEFRAWYQQFYE